MAKLTKRSVESLRPTESDRFVWDDSQPGFGVRVPPSGRRSFIVQYRTAEGRQRRRVVGRFPVMTVEQARRAAREWLVSAQRGGDPAEGIDISRQAASLGELCDRYIEEHGELHKKASSLYEDKRLIKARIKPALGSRKAASINQSDVQSLHRGMKATPYQANRVLALLSTIYSRTEGELRRGRPDWLNPCRGVNRFKEEKRRRYLAPAELARLGEALSVAEAKGLAEPEAIAAIRLLIFTGCRRSEILSLEWDEVDIENRQQHLPDSKSGAKDVQLPPPAIEVLLSLTRKPKNPYVITGRRKGSHLTDVKGPWSRIRDLAGLKELRLHDLRHSFASVGAGAGLSLPIIGALLGHSQPATTARYAHLARNPLQEAADLVGQRLADAMKGDRADGGEVVELRPPGRSRRKP
jgi:integrase